MSKNHMVRGCLLKVSARRHPGRCPGLQFPLCDDPLYLRGFLLAVMFLNWPLQNGRRSIFRLDVRKPPVISVES